MKKKHTFTHPFLILTRRAFMARTATLAAGYFFLPKSRVLSEEGSQTIIAESSLVKRVVRGPEQTYFAYPHSNGFLDASTFVVVRRISGTQMGGLWGLDYISFDPLTGVEQKLAQMPQAWSYYTIENGKMLVTTPQRAILLNISNPGIPPQVIYQAPEGWGIGDIFGLTLDAKRAVLPLQLHTNPQHSQMIQCDIENGTSQVLIDRPWQINHPHYSPFDQKWIAFCHEGSMVLDRIWAWNGEVAREGRMLFDQNRPDGPLYVGHERAMFNKSAEIFIGYPSPGQPHGLYEVSFEKVSRLVSASSTDLHCNISHDGRWAVVDSQPVQDPLHMDPVWSESSPSHEPVPRFSDVVVVNMKTGARQVVYRASMGPRHPWHVHPHISPDGKWVVFNDYKVRRVMAVEIDQEALKTFLS